MSLVPMTGYAVLVDEETRQLVVVTGDRTGDQTVIGPVVGNALLQDQHGDTAEITSDGRLHVVEHSGLPNYGTDAAGADAYTTVLTTTHRCSHVYIYAETKDAIVSFDAGVTDHFFLDVSAGQVPLSGLDIPAGAVIAAKNASAGNNYANLTISAW